MVISYARMQLAAEELDIDTTVINFRITAVADGTLKLRPAGSSVAGDNAVGLDLTASQELVWIPSTNTNDNVLAFRVCAVDAPSDGTTALTSAEQEVRVLVAADNDAPVLTSVNLLQQSVWAEDTDIVISYAKLRGEVQINDVENHPCILQVASTLTGTLRIRGAGMTDTGVDAVGVAFGVTKELVWRPLDDDNGDKQAFTIHALDVPGDGTTAKLSVDARTVTVHVAPVNDAPVLAGVSLLREADGAAIGVEDTDIVITYARAMAAASLTDREGDACNLRITAVSAGTLLLRAIAGGATVSALNRNLNADHELLWRPALNAYGDLEAFTVRAIDAPSDGTGAKLSVDAALVTVRVGPTDDDPVLEALALIEETGQAAAGLEDSDIVLDHARLLAAATMHDPDGGVVGFRITEVSSGTVALRQAGGGEAVDGGDVRPGVEAVWRPALDVSGVLPAFQVRALDATGRLSAATRTVEVRVAAVNDAPTVAAAGTVGSNDEDADLDLNLGQLRSACTAADVDNGASQLEALVSPPPGGILSIGVGGVFTAVTAADTVLPTGAVLRWHPTLNEYGPGRVVAGVRMRDPGSAVSLASTTLSVDLTPLDDAPSFSVPTLPRVVHTLGKAPTRLAPTAPLHDPDETNNYSGVELHAELLAGTGLASGPEDVLQLLPVGNLRLLRTGSGMAVELRSSSEPSRLLAQCAAPSVQPGTALVLRLGAETTRDDLNAILACLHYRNDLGRSASIALPRRVRLRFTGLNDGDEATVEILATELDPPAATVTAILVAPLSSATLTEGNLATLYTDRIVVTILPQFGTLSRTDDSVVLGLGSAFTPADVSAGRIRYNHRNANAGFDQIGLDLVKGALSITVLVPVNASQSAAEYLITSDPPMVMVAGATAAWDLATIIPSGASARCTWEVAELDGPGTVLLRRTENRVEVAPTAAGLIRFELRYRAYTGDLAEPTLTGAALARQRVQLVVMPVGTPVLRGPG